MKKTKKKHTPNSILKIIFAYFGIMLLIVAGLTFVFKIHLPAMSSMRDGCGLAAKDDGFVTVGKVIFEQTTFTESNYTIIIEDDKYQFTEEQLDMIYKHEMCHVSQMERGALKTCSADYGKFRRYVNECECYVLQYI